MSGRQKKPFFSDRLRSVSRVIFLTLRAAGCPSLNYAERRKDNQFLLFSRTRRLNIPLT